MKMFVIKLICVLLFVTITIAEEEQQSPGVRAVFRVLDDCQKSDGGFVMCIKKKSITFIDRIGKIDAIAIGDGLKVIRSEGSPAPLKALSETELEQSLPRGLEDRDEALTIMLVERVANLFSGRKVQINLPVLSSQELGRGIEEGRGKMKKAMSMMMMGFAMKMAAMVPVAIAGLYILAGKALIVSKVALLLAGIIALKKLLSSKGGSSGGGGGGGGWSGGQSQGWSSGGGSGGGNSGGWDRRSIDAQDVAYNGYSKKSQ